MLSRLLREVLFALLHCFLTLCELLAKFHEHLSIWWNPKEFPGCDAEYIARSVAALKRRPHHLVVLTESPWLETKELADLALWSLHARIPYISFYDADGTLKPKEAELFSEVEKRKCGVPGCIKWSQRPDLNGYSNGHKFFTCTINIFTRPDGKDRIAHFARDLIEHKVSCIRKEDNYSVDEIDPVLRLYYADIPDPDVIMFCGPLCMTRGLLPWQIRLAEFIPLRKQKAIRAHDFVHALRKYSKCDQRFGK